MKSRKSKLIFLAVLGITAGVSIVVCSAIGTADLSPGRIIKYLLTGDGLNEIEKNILFQLRLSRILLAGLVGFALSFAGTVFQALLRNPLADPYIIGISSGSALGAILALSLGLGLNVAGFGAVPAFAFLGGFLSLLLVYRLAKSGASLHSHTLLLTGVVVNAFFGAVIMFIISLVESNRLHGIMFWLMGNLSFTDFGRLGIIAVYLLISIAIVMAFAKDIDLLTLGDETAQQLGVEVDKVKKVVFFATALMVGAVVSLSGLIGFVGLIIPHAIRLIVGPRHRFLLPAAGLSGAIFLIISDTIARTILDPIEIPVGVVTAFLGAPCFIYLLKRKKKQAGQFI